MVALGESGINEHTFIIHHLYHKLYILQIDIAMSVYQGSELCNT